MSAMHLDLYMVPTLNMLNTVVVVVVVVVVVYTLVVVGVTRLLADKKTGHLNL